MNCLLDSITGNLKNALYNTKVYFTTSSLVTNQINYVLPYLYISDYKAAACVSDVKSYGIQILVSVTMNVFPQALIDMYSKQGIHYYSYPLNDVVQQNLDPTANTVDELLVKCMNMTIPLKVLVFCDMGVSRSASVVLYHLIKAHRMNYYAALIHLRTCRPIINPNDGFKRQLYLLSTGEPSSTTTPIPLSPSHYRVFKTKKKNKYRKKKKSKTK